MKIKVRTNFYGHPELQIESPTLKKVLHELSRKTNFPILNPSEQQVHSDFKVYLNGIEHEDLLHGIDTELKEEDRVEITMVVLAGG